MEKENQAVYTVGGLMIDDDQKEITVDGEPVKLNPDRIQHFIVTGKKSGESIFY